MARIALLIREVRAEFLTASVIPVLLGVAVAEHERGLWDPALALLTLVGAALMHLATNTANDYFDHLSGADAANTQYARPFTGGTRLIQEGLLSPRAVGRLALSLTAAAVAVGVILFIARGPGVLAFGAVGIFLGYFYTGPPLRLAHRGLGEAAVGAGYGLISIGAFYVQTGAVSLPCVVASLPPALLVTCIIVINEFQDFQGDMAAGKRTAIVRIGRRRGVVLFAALMSTAFAVVIAGVRGGLLPPLSLLSLLALPPGVAATVIAARYHDQPARMAPANAMTIISHAAAGLLLTLAFALS